jgi:hypothetical protein
VSGSADDDVERIVWIINHERKERKLF